MQATDCTHRTTITRAALHPYPDFKRSQVGWRLEVHAWCLDCGEVPRLSPSRATLTADRSSFRIPARWPAAVSVQTRGVARKVALDALARAQLEADHG